jgi:hypothetical protein
VHGQRAGRTAPLALLPPSRGDRGGGVAAAPLCAAKAAMREAARPLPHVLPSYDCRPLPGRSLETGRVFGGETVAACAAYIVPLGVFSVGDFPIERL